MIFFRTESFIGLVFSVLLANSSAGAEAQAPNTPDVPTEGSLTKVAVFNFEAKAGIDQAATDLVSEALLASLREIKDVSVIGSREIDSLLGLEKSKAALGCDEGSCVAEIGGALGVDKLVIGSIGKLGQTIVYTVKVLDVKSARIEQSFHYQLKNGSDDQLLELVTPSVSTVFQGYVTRDGRTLVPVVVALPSTTPSANQVASTSPAGATGTASAASPSSGAQSGEDGKPGTESEASADLGPSSHDDGAEASPTGTVQAQAGTEESEAKSPGLLFWIGAGTAGLGLLTSAGVVTGLVVLDNIDRDLEVSSSNGMAVPMLVGAGIGLGVTVLGSTLSYVSQLF